MRTKLQKPSWWAGRPRSYIACCTVSGEGEAGCRYLCVGIVWMLRDLNTYRLEVVTVMRDDNNSFFPHDVQVGLNDSNRTSNPVSPSPTWLCRPIRSGATSTKTRPDPRAQLRCTCPSWLISRPRVSTSWHLGNSSRGGFSFLLVYLARGLVESFPCGRNCGSQAVSQEGCWVRVLRERTCV